MCGIAGIFSTDGSPIDEQVLRAMGDSIAHRGPDGEGVHVDRGRGFAVGLVNRRLAVIDIEAGRQPMPTEDGRFTIVYNGELFNAAEVRRELESAGHRFRTRCDTEVVLRGYAEWGDEVLARLNGMWAFAVWDKSERRLFIARDRLGVKPLVYAETPQGFVFGSEIKALVASGLVARELDEQALPHYLAFFAVPEPYSLVRGVRRLRAGHTLTVDANGVREREYWDCAFPEEDDRGRDAFRDELGDLLEDSVRRRLVADVPLGVLLSSGIDSSVVATMAARNLESPLRTFTLGFGAGAADERPAARELAHALGASHHEDVIGPGRAADDLPRLLVAYDEPGQSLLQTHFVSELARREVTVALSGLGGDELFSGYPAHVVASVMARIDAVPGPLRAPLLAAAKLAPNQRVRRLPALADMDPDERASTRLLHATEAELRHDLLDAGIRAQVDLDAPAEHLRGHFARAQAQDPLNRLLYVYVKTYLPDELLRATDAMSMLHSLEVRTPFLDYRLVERALRVPAVHKMRGRTGKLVLRDIAAQTLPTIPSPGKRGFTVPLSTWLGGDLKEKVRDVLTSSTARERGVFDPTAVDTVVRQCLAGNDRLVPAVMMLYNFETWARDWLDAPASGAAPVGLPIELQQAPPEPSTDLSVIVVNWNTREMLRNCLASLDRHLTKVDHEVIVIDNDSSDGSPDMVEEQFPNVRLVRNADNVGFGRANNQAMRMAHGKWFLLLNSDTLLNDETVGELFERVRRDESIGVAHCRLLFEDGRQQFTTYPFPNLKTALVEDLGIYKVLGKQRAGELLLTGYWDYDEERDVDWVAGAFMLMPRAVFEQTGGFDERLFMYGEDLEWCQRIRDHGWRIRFYPQAAITHFDHSSSEIRWGDERFALCLRRQRDIYAERSGRMRATTLMGLHLVGAVMRTGYYSLRSVIGPRTDAYKAMKRSSTQALAALLPLLVRR